MKAYLAVFLLACSTPSFAEGWLLGLYAGHQNLKTHSKGSSYESFMPNFNPSGPITGTKYAESDNIAGSGFTNSNIQGFRLGYQMENLSLVTDIGGARYFPTPHASFDVASIGFQLQYHIYNSPGLGVYSISGLNLVRMKVTPYETTSSYSGEPISYYGEGDFSHPVDVGNYTVGLGLGIPLAEKLSLFLDARYSDTLIKGQFLFKAKGVYRNTTDSLEVEGISTSNNVTLTTQDLLLGLIFKL